MMKVVMLVSWIVFTATLNSIAQSANLVSVKAEIDTDHNDAKDSVTEVIRKKLGIKLSGTQSVTGELRVVSVLYARDLKENKTVVEKTTESTVSLDSNHSAVVIPPSVTFTYTPSHSKSSGSGRRRKSVKVEATGRKYYGWTVQVYQGAKLLGEAASSVPLLKFGQ